MRRVGIEDGEGGDAKVARYVVGSLRGGGTYAHTKLSYISLNYTLRSFN